MDESEIEYRVQLCEDNARSSEATTVKAKNAQDAAEKIAGEPLSKTWTSGHYRAVVWRTDVAGPETHFFYRASDRTGSSS